MSRTRDTQKGPPKGNKNAVKHGYFTQEEIRKRKAIHRIIRNIKTITEELK